MSCVTSLVICGTNARTTIPQKVVKAFGITSTSYKIQWTVIPPYLIGEFVSSDLHGKNISAVLAMKKNQLQVEVLGVDICQIPNKSICVWRENKVYLSLIRSSLNA